MKCLQHKHQSEHRDDNFSIDNSIYYLYSRCVTNKTYLSHNNRIHTLRIKRNTARPSLEHLNPSQGLLLQLSAHIIMRLNGDGPKPLRTSSQDFGELARSGSQVQDFCSLSTGQLQSCEEFVSLLVSVGWSVFVVGGSLGEADLGWVREGLR